MAQGEPIVLVNLLELSGPIASAGINYRNGVELAVKEINAAGGVLGRKFEVTTLDTQSNPGVSKALAQKAVDMGAFAVIGPTFSGAMVVSAVETRRAEIPNFTGAAAASITQQGNPYVIRTNTTQAASMPKLARYIKEGLKAQHGRHRLHQLRLRQGRPRRIREGGGRARPQGRRRHLDRPGAGRLLRPPC